jgi:hypothetical protein
MCQIATALRDGFVYQLIHLGYYTIRWHEPCVTSYSEKLNSALLVKLNILMLKEKGHAKNKHYGFNH